MKRCPETYPLLTMGSRQISYRSPLLQVFTLISLGVVLGILLDHFGVVLCVWYTPLRYVSHKPYQS